MGAVVPKEKMQVALHLQHSTQTQLDSHARYIDESDSCDSNRCLLTVML